jgi:hypothetical protein
MKKLNKTNVHRMYNLLVFNHNKVSSLWFKKNYQIFLLEKIMQCLFIFKNSLWNSSGFFKENIIIHLLLNKVLKHIFVIEIVLNLFDIYWYWSDLVCFHLTLKICKLINVKYIARKH